MTATWEFVLNRKSKRLHLKRDGRDFPQCNLDQIKSKLVSLHLSALAGVITYTRCKRCFSAPDAPIG